MISRERVRKVLTHQIPDRIPNGLGGCETVGLHMIAYDELQKLLGVESKPPRLDTFMTNAVFEEPVIRAMDGDIILLDSPNMCGSRLRGNVADQWKEQTLWGRTFSVSAREHFRENSDGSVTWVSRGDAICPPGTFYFDYKGTTDLLADFDVPDPDGYHPPETISDELLRHLEEQAKRLYEETDLSICLGESVTDLQIQPGGMIGAMILMVEEPDVMRAFLEKSMEASLKQIALLDQAVGKYVDILSIAHDFGDNRGVTIGADLWRKIYKPYYRRYFEGWKKTTDMKINLHSCGSIASIMGDLIECGVQVVNPIQTSAADMDAVSLKARFGRDVIFWGGAYDAQLISQADTYEDVYRKVFDNIKTLGADGNYIFGGVHNLPGDVSQTHLSAMLDAYRDARDY